MGAREWHEEQRIEREREEALDKHAERLRYAGEKKHDMPDPDVFRKAGMTEVADKIQRALSLLQEASWEVQSGRR
jgi:hypothetical protein